MISKTYVLESVSLVSEESVRRTIDYHDITWLGSWLWCSFCTWTRGKFTTNYGTHNETWLYRSHWDEAKNWINYNLCSREVPGANGGGAEVRSESFVTPPPLDSITCKMSMSDQETPVVPFSSSFTFPGSRDHASHQWLLHLLSFAT